MRIGKYLPVFILGTVCAAAVLAVQPDEPGRSGRALVAGGAVGEAAAGAMQTLDRLGIAVDTNAARRAAILAIIRAADPGAKLLTANDAGLDEAQAGTSAGGTRRKPIALLEKWPKGICYVKFAGLYAGSGAEVAAQMRGASNGASGMILDLRKAGGNGLDCARSVAGLFAPEDTEIFSVRANGSGTEKLRTGRGERLGVPAVILTDGDTSGAAELLAAAMKGSPEVLLVGGRTRGDARVREKVVLESGDEVLLATRRVTPSRGRAPDTDCVEPDVVVKEAGTAAAPKTDAKSPDADPKTGDKEESEADQLVAKAESDPVLQRAIDVLVGLRAIAVFSPAARQ